MSVTGGENLKRYLRETKARAAQLENTVIEVGFKDRKIATLAMGHEFGIPQAGLPERPAFRVGVERLPDVICEHQAQWRGLPTDEQIVELAIAMRDVIRQSYSEFEGTPLSERQKERKAGTPFADTQLTGAEGPKMIEHIGAWVNGVQVG